MKLRIALLRSDGPHHKYLERLLDEHFDLVCVVEESHADQVRHLRREGRWVDWFWWKYHALRKRVLGVNIRRQREFESAFNTDIYPFPETLRVEAINDNSVANAVRVAAPDMTIIIGTGILKRRTIQAIPSPVINVHGGYLPHYRGNHCFFFALLDGRPDLVGSTIHFVDAGVDTGDLIERISAVTYPGATAEELYDKTEKRAFHRLVELLSAYEAGEALPRTKQGLGGRTFRMRDRKPHHDLLLWLRRWLGHVH